MGLGVLQGPLDLLTGWIILAIIVILGFLAVLGLVNAVVVIWRTLRPSGRSSARAGEGSGGPGGPAQGLISMYAYLAILADVLLVVVAVELIETLLAFLTRADSQVYLSGVIGAAMVALARRIIVFFNPEAPEARHNEMYAYAALVGVLAAAYWVVRTVR